MRTKHDNEFKVMIVELLLSGIKTKQVSEEYGLDASMIRRWRREYKLKPEIYQRKENQQMLRKK